VNTVDRQLTILVSVALYINIWYIVLGIRKWRNENMYENWRHSVSEHRCVLCDFADSCVFVGIL
jgi:hypothetical protein